MAKYPAIQAGARLTAPLLSSMLPEVIVKPATTDRASTTTLTTDPDLKFTGVAGASYLIEFNLMPAATLGSGNGTSGTTPGGFVTEWTVPAGASGLKNVLGPSTTANNGSADQITMRAGVHVFGTNVEYSGVRNDNELAFGVREFGVVTLVSGGTVGIAWAQRFSSATATSLFLGSYMTVRRIS